MPVLKLPPIRLLPVLLALEDHEYDRDGFKQAVLSLFAQKLEKSVFRGMAIPTLRALGLLVGFEREMRLSGDGALAVAAYDRRNAGNNPPLQRLLSVIEEERGLSVWRSRSVPLNQLLSAFYKIEGADPTKSGDFDRRARRWLTYLEFFTLVTREGERFRRIRRVRSTGLYKPSMKVFAADLKSAYKDSMPREVGEPVISIEDLHRHMAIQCWRNNETVLIRHDFDRLLVSILESGKIYAHLHRSMGAEQRLFTYKNVAYEAINLGET